MDGNEDSDDGALGKAQDDVEDQWGAAALLEVNSGAHLCLDFITSRAMQAHATFLQRRLCEQQCSL